MQAGYSEKGRVLWRGLLRQGKRVSGLIGLRLSDEYGERRRGESQRAGQRAAAAARRSFAVAGVLRAVSRRVVWRRFVWRSDRIGVLRRAEGDDDRRVSGYGRRGVFCGIFVDFGA